MGRDHIELEASPKKEEDLVDVDQVNLDCQRVLEFGADEE